MSNSECTIRIIKTRNDFSNTPHSDVKGKKAVNYCWEVQSRSRLIVFFTFCLHSARVRGHFLAGSNSKWPGHNIDVKQKKAVHSVQLLSASFWSGPLFPNAQNIINQKSDFSEKRQLKHSCTYWILLQSYILNTVLHLYWKGKKFCNHDEKRPGKDNWILLSGS